jgi:hypothetical protein
MTNQEELRELKKQIQDVIRRNSDRGFVPYSGCNRIAWELSRIIEIATGHVQSGNYQQGLEIYLLVLLQTIKLISHADDSSGCCGEIILYSLEEINKLCKILAETDDGEVFKSILKAARNKAFQGWEEWAYKLLLAAVPLVRNVKQGEKIKELFPVLGTMYDDKDYPEKALILLGIKERLEGEEEGKRFLLDNINLPELRKILIERSIVAQEYDFAEKLCKEALEKKIEVYYHRPSNWDYFLEQIYSKTNNETSLYDIIKKILFVGRLEYFYKLKELLIQQGRWEQERDNLWQELAVKIGVSNYAELLSRENELERLLEVVKQHPSLIQYYGTKLGGVYPDEVGQLFETYILIEAKAANNRREYRQVSQLLNLQSQSVGKDRALELIDSLKKMYPQRPAMLDELEKRKNKLKK